MTGRNAYVTTPCVSPPGAGASVSSIGMLMELTLVPAPGGETQGVVTYAFRSVTEEPYHGGAE